MFRSAQFVLYFLNTLLLVVKAARQELSAITRKEVAQKEILAQAAMISHRGVRHREVSKETRGYGGLLGMLC